MTDSAQDHVRLFVACEIPDDVKETIGEVIEGLRQKSGSAVRWIKPDGVHVTLKFLGEVPTKKLPAIKLAIQEAVVGHSPFELEFSTIGTFGGREGLRIMWVGIAGDVLRLEALVRACSRAMLSSAGSAGRMMSVSAFSTDFSLRSISGFMRRPFP